MLDLEKIKRIYTSNAWGMVMWVANNYGAVTDIKALVDEIERLRAVIEAGKVSVTPSVVGVMYEQQIYRDALRKIANLEFARSLEVAKAIAIVALEETQG